MNTYHCPKYGVDFQHEEIEAVFCPRCLVTLATQVPSSAERIPLHKRDIWPVLKVIVWCVAAGYLIVFESISIAQERQPIEPVAFILGGPLWCCVSYPPVRFFIREHSGRTGVLTLLVWLFSFGALITLPALIQSKMFLLSNLAAWRTPFCMLPGAFIAYKLGSTEHFARKLFAPIKTFAD